MILEDFLRTDAEKYPSKVAAICGEQAMTYEELYNAVLQRSRDFSHKKGKAVIFPTTQSIDFLITYFAIHLAGAVAVPLEQQIPEERKLDIQSIAEKDELPEGAADILFTTGTTGKSKGVIISHSTIIAEAENLSLAQGFNKDTVFIICGPLNHIGCLSKVFPIIMQGGTLLILEGMKDLNAFFNALEYPSDKLATFLVPANIRILCTLGAKRLKEYSHKLDFIETGAAPMMHADMLKVCELLPTTRMYNTYASTETGIIATFNYNVEGKKRCMEGCLGKAMKNSHFEITPKGTIACKGKTLMMGYAGDKELSRQVLHDNTVYTSDMGRIDEDGMIHMLGREDDVINTGGLKVAPTEVESIALELPEIEDCICIAATHPIMGVVPRLLIVQKADCSLDKKKIANHLASKLERYKVPFYYEVTDKIARTYNGKINRKFYR